MTDVRKDFPTLGQTVHGKPLVYLDSAATSMRPACVLDAVRAFYEESGANPHRGLYQTGEAATAAYDNARRAVAGFVGCQPEELVFTRNTTEALNLVAYSFAPTVLGQGGVVALPVSEHHSNLVPWQQAAKRAGATLRYLYPDENGELPDAEMERKITGDVKLVAFAHVSNVTGRVLPVEKLVARARAVGAYTVLDCAQSVAHMPLDVTALGVDFAAFSGHKMYGPMGIGALYGKAAHLAAMPPFLTGGDMIDSVSEQDATWAPLPHKFEAGTVNAGGAVGLAAAVKYIQAVGWPAILRHEQTLVKRLAEGLAATPGVSVLCGAGGERVGAVPFTLEGVHPHDVATLLDAKGIAIRAGHHCAQPLHQFLGLRATCRASLGVYSTAQDVDALLAALPDIRRRLGHAS